jgi:predicted transcriptional regulator
MMVLCHQEVAIMVALTLRLPDELHEKLRWLAFKERRSQHAILLELVEKALSKVEVPAEVKDEDSRKPR